MFICVINVGERSVACHSRSDWQVLSRSDAVISQPLCSLLQVSEMMLALIGDSRLTCVGVAHVLTTAAAAAAAAAVVTIGISALYFLLPSLKE